MHELTEQAQKLQTAVSDAADRLAIKQLGERLETLRMASLQPDFWTDNARAQDNMKEITKLEGRVAPWIDLQQALADVVELLSLGDISLKTDLRTQISHLTEQFAALKEELKLTGPYDGYDAIVSLHAGAGGTDAQDWAQMLLRMYVRWAEKSSLTTQMIEESAGDEAGLKSATLEISGSFAYGKLKSEHGVHRLVRLSPFNAESRETSFARVEVMPKIGKPNEVVIDEKDLKVDVYRSGGHGGQSVNTTDSAVRVTHLPTGLVVAIQNERSQLQNRETALTILRSRLAQLQLEQHAENVRELKGPSSANEFGSQIRSYVLHPYKQVKDLRTRYETSDVDGVLGGNLDPLINAYLEHNLN